jgi:hypothetical protein
MGYFASIPLEKKSFDLTSSNVGLMEMDNYVILVVHYFSLREPCRRAVHEILPRYSLRL